MGADAIIQFYYSKGILIAMFVVGPVVVVTRLWMLSVILCVGFLSIFNWRLLRFRLLHSFDLYLQILSAVIICAGDTMIRWERFSDDGLNLFNQMSAGLASALAILIGQSLDAYHAANWIKNTVIVVITSRYCWYFAQLLYGIGVFGDVDDIRIHVPGIDHTVSVRNLMLVAFFNVIILFLRKLLFQIRCRECISVATYPKSVWTSTQNMEADPLQRQRARTLTMSLDIYKQSLTQNVELHLLENHNILNLVFSANVAGTLQKVKYQYIHSMDSPDSKFV